MNTLTKEMGEQAGTPPSGKAARMADATATTNGDAGVPLRHLLPQHLADLRKSGLSEGTIRALKFASVTEERHVLDVLKWGTGHGPLLPALEIPFLNRDGEMTGFARLKPDKPRTKKKRNGEAENIKYEQPKGQPIRPYIPPMAWPLIDDPAQPLLFTEGEKKCAKAVQEGFACIGLTGVDCWSIKAKRGTDGKRTEKRQLLPELAALPLRGRASFIVYDSNITEKRGVQSAEVAFGHALGEAGAIVKAVRLPPGPDGHKQGLDDYLVSHSVEEFRCLLDAAESVAVAVPPGPLECNDGRLLVQITPNEGQVVRQVGAALRAIAISTSERAGCCAGDC